MAAWLSVLRSPSCADGRSSPVGPATRPMSDSTIAGWKVPADDSGSWSGLLIEWRRGPAGWLALVIYIVSDGITSTTIQGWLPAESIRPA